MSLEERIQNLIMRVETDEDARRELTDLGASSVPALIPHIDGMYARLVLRDIGEPAIEPLIAALDGDPKLRKGIIWTLGELPSRLTIIDETLLGLLDRPNLTRPQRMECIGALGKRKVYAAFDRIAAMLKEVDHRDVVLVMQALGWLGDARAVELLAPYLKSENTVLRRAAVNAMRWIENAAAVDPLLDVLIQDSEAVIRNEAARVLGELGDPRAVPLIEAHADMNDPMVVEALKRLRD